MVSALGFTVLLEHPASAVHAALPDAALRRALMGCAMGATAITLVLSPWGQRSGAHFNPALTLTFFRLGKIEPADALGYVAAQFVGGALGVVAIAALLGSFVADPQVNYATGHGNALLEILVGTIILRAFPLIVNLFLISHQTKDNNSRKPEWMRLCWLRGGRS